MEGLEEGAISILKRAVELDQKHRWTESMVCYQEGLQLLMNVIKMIPDERRREAFRTKAGEYMNRAETLKRLTEDEKKRGSYHEQIHIEADSTGHSYETVLGRFLDASVTSVDVEDPYIRSVYQCQNLVRLCELLVRRCRRLRLVRLLTGVDAAGAEGQRHRFQELAGSLLQAGVQLEITYSTTLHDREIRLNNGWVVKIGRGLSYFKPPTGKFSLGSNDLDLRRCQETTVDIFHRSSLVSEQ